jgi:hypothetical protein
VVARAFIREGARAFLVGRTCEPLEAVADITVARGNEYRESVDGEDG